MVGLDCLILSHKLYYLIRFILNSKEISTELPPGLPLLDFIRYNQQLFGTKIGCREGDCGACTILVGEIKSGQLRYTSATSCLMPLGNAKGKHIVSIEGINMEKLNPIQHAMSEEGATQCGFCTPGFVVSLAGFILSPAEPNYTNAIAAVNGNICRCTGYKSIERAAKRITELMKDRKEQDAMTFIMNHSMLPSYFVDIKGRLENLAFESSTPKSRPGRLVGGGTDLYVQQHENMIEADIDFFFDRKDYKPITIDGNICEVGAEATVTDIIESPIFQDYFPGLGKFIKLVSSTPIRNMATVAGNFINASPIGDMTIFFLALDAQLQLSDGGHTRQIPLRSLYKGYKVLDKKAEEFIEKLSFKLPGKDEFFNFEKVSKRTHLDIASVNTAILVKVKESIILKASISAGGVGPIPMYLAKCSSFLEGKALSSEIIDECVGVTQGEISPISDTRGSEEYKRLLLGQLIKCHFMGLSEP